MLWAEAGKTAVADRSGSVVPPGSWGITLAVLFAIGLIVTRNQQAHPTAPPTCCPALSMST